MQPEVRQFLHASFTEFASLFDHIIHCKKSSRVSRRQAVWVGVKQFGLAFLLLPIPFEQLFPG
jgi:hypothetical protein